MTIDRRRFALAAGALALGAATQARAAGAAIDEGGFVPINGVEQWIGLRGQDSANPMMLFLHGGPGIGINHAAPVFADWERSFTMAYWDMPHSGATHAHNLSRDEGPLTVVRFVDDAVAVAEHLKARNGGRKIALFGISFGTRVGTELIHRRPDLFSAYVGTAQVASGPRGMRMGYDMALAAARARRDSAAVAGLEKAGPPPYRTLEQFLARQMFTNPPGQPSSAAETAANAALAKLVAATPPNKGPSVPKDLPTFDVWANFMRVLQATFPESALWEAASLGRDFKVPVFVFHGADDLNTPAALAREWVETIRAPRKAYAELAGASHNTIPFHAELIALMRRHVLPVIRA